MCVLEKVPSEVGLHDGVRGDVLVAPESTVHTTFDADFAGEDSRSVLDTDAPNPGLGDSSSCHHDVTVVEHKAGASADLAAGADDGTETASAESLDRTLAIARGETVMRTAELLQASELAKRVPDIRRLIAVVATQVMRVMRPWLVQQADVATTPNRFTAELHWRINHYVEQAITQLLARLSR